ncbi:serine/threonine-protein kinase Chk2 [Paragonimus westermani]|uniref:Serine/threonine-protein kinase Chk2 n=1 Tax=Paragonimus westermani TaxID=34504 RepID=A0A5J4NE38_9TREM|nr:serine/threonine-protein kinase Chk2 [Paragonimus westermani]
MVELLPTQDIDETHNLNSDIQEHSYTWGRLLPLKSRLPAIVFVFSDSYSSQNGYPPEVTVRYTVSNLLGRGACGEVRLVFEKASCERRAMKIVQKKTFSVPSKLGNPCVIYIYDVIDTDDAVYMILELVEGGELFDRIVNLGQLPECDAKFLFLQMAIAVEPENILLENSEHRCLIKVTDFGLSKFVDGNTMLRTFCGTPTYLAPEILKTAGSGTYTSAIDIWSLGVILYVCLVGYPPFTDERLDHDLHSQIVNGLYDFPDPYWKDISGEAQDLVRRMLTVEPSERLTIKAVLDHPWLNDVAIKSEVYALIDKPLPSDSTAVSTTPNPALTTGCNEQSTVNEGPQQCIGKPDSSSPTGDPALPDDNTILQDKPLIRKRPLFQSCPLPSKQPAL